MVTELKMVLGNGVELAYEEHGRGNKETIIMGQFYYGTFQRWLDCLAEQFHVYAMKMRFDGKATHIAEDGKINWAEQWGDDVYEFSRALGLSKFIYLGKCHGSIPGWYLVDKHPEVLKAFVIGSLLPANRIPKPPNPVMIMWGQALANGTPDVLRAGLKQLLRRPETIEPKLQEILSADGKKIAGTMGYGNPLTHLKTNEQLADWYSKIKLPVLLIYGTEDPGLDDEMLMLATKTVPGMKLVMFQGERHFYEMDIPEKLADEIKLFIAQVNRPHGA
jgi:pimeloyl-ACP methyl ester carboxylesterase